MQFQQRKSVTAGAWLLVITLIAFMANPQSPSWWLALAVLAVLPPAVMWWFWSAPDQSMSESIQKALR